MSEHILGDEVALQCAASIAPRQRELHVLWSTFRRLSHKQMLTRKPIGWPWRLSKIKAFARLLVAIAGIVTDDPTSLVTSIRPGDRFASLVGLGAGRHAGLRSDVVLAGVDQDQNGHERRGDQPEPDPERDVIAVDRRERVERGR